MEIKKTMQDIFDKGLELSKKTYDKERKFGETGIAQVEIIALQHKMEKQTGNLGHFAYNQLPKKQKIADLEQVAEEIKAKGVKSIAIAAHNAKIEDSKALIEQVMKAFGRIDILMNNAGTNPYYGPLMETDEKTYDITMNVNLKGILFLSQLAARNMKTQGGGCIVNTSSIGGLRAGDLGG